MPDGRVNIDGFVCVFDVSLVPNRTLEKQVETTAQILNSLLKTKKPVVLATTARRGSGCPRTCTCGAP